MPQYVIRRVCLIGLPLLLLTAVSLLYWFDGALLSDETHHLSPWLNAFYIISLTANIGYFTNFVAIKMLFRPYHKTLLGRQGLIPKNQPKLAKALSITLNDHFLSENDWGQYLTQSKVVHQTLNALKHKGENWLQQPENTLKLKSALIKILQNNQSTLDPLLQKIKRQTIEQQIDQLDFPLLTQQLFSWFEQQMRDNPQKMENLINPIVNTIAGNIPTIARHLIDSLDAHIESQSTLRRQIAKAARWSSNIDEEEIKAYLFRMIASQNFRETLYQGLQSIIKSCQETGSSDTETNPFIHFGQNIKPLLKELLIKKSEHLISVETLINLIKNTIKPDKLQAIAEKLFKQAINWLEHLSVSPKTQQLLNQQIVNLIQKINLKSVIESKAKNFSPQQMEHLFNVMIKDQLVFIELLGALLGGLSGLALVNLNLFFGITLLGASIYLVDNVISKKKSPHYQPEKNSSSTNFILKQD